MKFATLALLVLIISADASARVCFWADKVTHVRGVNPQQIEIQTLLGRYLGTGSFCWNLKFARRFDFGMNPNFCEGDFLRTEYETCRIDRLQRF